MENKDKNLITFSEETQIDLPGNREMFAIEKIDWQRIKELVKEIDLKSGRWENAGWFMSSTTIAALIEYIIIDSTSKPIWMTTTIFCLIITILLFSFSYFFSKTTSHSKQKVFAEMDLMEKKIPKAENNTEKSSMLKIVTAIYGQNDRNKDITEQLNKLVKGDQLNIVVSNEIGGDPYPGKMKELTMKYNFKGEEFERKYREGETITLP